jgi:hypothetical protein
MVYKNKGIIKLSPVDHVNDHGIFIVVQKESNSKEESFSSTEPDRLITKFTTQIKKVTKLKIKVFLRKIFVNICRCH